MNKHDGRSNKTDISELAKVGHTLSTALFEGDLDKCVAIILDHGNSLGYDFSRQSLTLLNQTLSSPSE